MPRNYFDKKRRMFIDLYSLLYEELLRIQHCALHLFRLHAWLSIHNFAWWIGPCLQSFYLAVFFKHERKQHRINSAVFSCSTTCGFKADQPTVPLLVFAEIGWMSFSEPVIHPCRRDAIGCSVKITRRDSEPCKIRSSWCHGCCRINPAGPETSRWQFSILLTIHQNIQNGAPLAAKVTRLTVAPLCTYLCGMILQSAVKVKTWLLDFC